MTAEQVDIVAKAIYEEEAAVDKLVREPWPDAIDSYKSIWRKKAQVWLAAYHAAKACEG